MQALQNDERDIQDKGKKAQASPSLFKRMLSLFTGPEEEAAPKRDAKPKRTKSVKAAQAQQEKGPRWHLAGDCLSPRTALEAVYEGHALARAL